MSSATCSGVASVGIRRKTSSKYRYRVDLLCPAVRHERVEQRAGRSRLGVADEEPVLQPELGIDPLVAGLSGGALDSITEMTDVATETACSAARGAEEGEERE